MRTMGMGFLVGSVANQQPASSLGGLEGQHFMTVFPSALRNVLQWLLASEPDLEDVAGRQALERQLQPNVRHRADLGGDVDRGVGSHRGSIAEVHSLLKKGERSTLAGAVDPPSGMRKSTS